jgi:sugar/nucleoside kinase (ribokinase family)
MIDYLAIGHVCCDTSPEGPRLGGTVSFSALTAHALGMRAAILTSAPEDRYNLLAPLREMPLESIPASDYTTFENTYTPQGRTQRLLGHAERITAAHIPDTWREARIVHLAPVADEIDPTIINLFPNALIGITPQGWMRQWDASARVSFKHWQPSSALARRADAVVMSIEDVQGDETIVHDFADRFKLLIVTHGEHGCTVYREGKIQHISAPPVDVLDPTGAGDIFAVVFFSQLLATHDPASAARIAVRVASDSVTRLGLDSIPDVQRLHSLIGNQ